MMFAWSCGLALPLTALNVKPRRRPASAAAACCASQYGLPEPCSSHTMLGLAALDAAPAPPTNAMAETAAAVASATAYERRRVTYFTGVASSSRRRCTCPAVAVVLRGPSRAPSLHLHAPDDEPAVDVQRRAV